MPDSDSTEANAQSNVPAIWEDRWGAIAADFAKGKFGAGNAKRTKQEAEIAALNDCRREGGVSCEIDLTYYNQCGVIAWGTNDARTARAGTKDQAVARAIETCSKQTTDCKIYYADCSYPIRVQ